MKLTSKNNLKPQRHQVTKAILVVFSLYLGVFVVRPSFASEVEIHGFLLGTISSRISDTPLANSGETNNWLISETRLRLDLSADSDAGDTSIQAKLDFIQDGVSNTSTIDVRELYAEYLADHYEVRVGRQMLTWGVADRVFINDVFPKDWAAFFAGKPLEYMKIASDMIKTSVFIGDWDAEVTLTPNATFDVVPSASRFVLYNPPGVTGVTKPQAKASNLEAAMRVHSTIGAIDVAFYASRGFWHQPDKGFDGVSKVIYPRLNTYGLTLQQSVLGGVLSFEAGLYDSVDDKAGSDPLIANSQQRWLIGYEHDIATDVTLAVQLYGEIMQDYDLYLSSAQAAFNAGQGPQPLEKHRKIATVNLRSLWLNQTLTARFFTMLVEKGGQMYNPDMNYAVTDAFSINGGAHWFTKGPDSWLLGMMKPNDNVYINAKWGF